MPFPFFAGSVEDVADRLQANLNRVSNDWRVFTPDEERTNQRLLSGSWDEYDWDGAGVSETDVNVDISSEQKCWDVLGLCYSVFGLPFYVNGYDIVIGGSAVLSPHLFQYGVVGGLSEIERTDDEAQELVTKVWGYGSETNLPLNYYANVNGIPYVTFGTPYEADYYIPHYYVFLSVDISSCFTGTPQRLSHSHEPLQQYSDFYYTGKVSVSKDGALIDCEYCKNEKVLEAVGVKGVLMFFDEATYNWLLDQTLVKRFYFRDGISMLSWVNGGFPMEPIDSGVSYPTALSINKLMLPGFPLKSLRSWLTECSSDAENVDGSSKWGGLSAADASSLLSRYVFSDSVFDPWVGSRNMQLVGELENVVNFDGSGEKEIFPTIRDNSSASIFAAEQIADSGYLDGNDIGFSIYMHRGSSYLDWGSLWNNALDKSGVYIEMTSGYCTGRKFKVTKVVSDRVFSTDVWTVSCERSKDSSLDRYFPYRDSAGSLYCQLQQGDTFIVTGIQIPEEYVTAASVRLLLATCGWLDKRDHIRYTYSPKINSVWMARQHLAATGGYDASTFGSVSLHDSLKAGMQFQFADASDLGIERYGSASIFIDQLTIVEDGEGGVAKYDIVLRDEKEKGAFDKLTEKISELMKDPPVQIVERQRQVLQYVEYDSWDADAIYYFETLNPDTMVLETSKVWHYGILWLCGRTGTQEEPCFGCSDWTPLSGNVVSLLCEMSLGDWMDVSEENELTCRVCYGEEDVTAKVTEWSITRDSGDYASDAVWNATVRAQSFDGTFTLLYSDLGEDIPTTFIIVASKNDVPLARLEIEV